MLLQKMRHSPENMRENYIEKSIITHGVDEILSGQDFTICGRAIPDSYIDYEGYERVGDAFRGSISKCDCKDCLKIIEYYKKLR